MKLRTLVPILGAIALTSTPALAVDVAKGLTIGGWVDTILYVSDTNAEDDDLSERSENAPGIGFTASASLKVGWQVTDALSAKMNLWFNPGTDSLNMREAYFTWAFAPELSWTMGKYINHVGWTSAEPTGLYRVNGGIITSLYGAIDVIGTALAYAPKDSAFGGSLHIVNGYFQGEDAGNNIGIGNPDRSLTRENTDLGFGLDLNFNFGEGLVNNINVEGIYDMSGADAGADEIGGDVAQVGVNATIKSVNAFVFGAELIYRSTSDSAPAESMPQQTDLGAMVLANYALSTKTPMSITGQASYVTNEVDGDEDETTTMELAAALRTNRLGNTNFGLNFELAYQNQAPAGGGDDVNGVTFSMEGLVVIP